MNRLTFLGLMLTLGVSVSSACDLPRTVDLRGQRALEELSASNPTHFKSIQQILARLAESRGRADLEWLRTDFNARDIDLQRFILRTSYPAKQLLQFSLDDVRYKLYVVRSDLDPAVTPAVERFRRLSAPSDAARRNEFRRYP